MAWTLVYSEEFERWLVGQVEELQDEALANLDVLAEIGPSLSRPKSDTLKGSKLPNLKELRFEFERAPFRILYAFDPKREALIMLAGNKASDKRWYPKHIAQAEKMFARHLEKLKEKAESDKDKGK